MNAVASIYSIERQRGSHKSIKHRVQNPRRVTNPKMQLVRMRGYAHVTYNYVAHLRLIASVELASKILRELACTSREAPRFLALEPESFSTTAAYSFVFAA